MDRRQFLTGLAGATAALAAGPARAGRQDAYQAAFAAAIAERPWLVGFESAAGDRGPERLATEGRWPVDLAGDFYRNGPGRHDRAGMRYHHWFDGDGLVHRWAIRGGAVEYRARFVRSAKFVAEEQAGRFLYDAGGTQLADARPATIGELNVANTSVLPVPGALWALWEGGSPTALDPATLATRGPVELGPALKGAPFSAHPRIGQDGRIWNIGIFGTKLALYRLARTGALEQVRLIEVDAVGMVHDFFLTERSMVVLLPSTDMSGTGEGFFGRIRGRADQPMQLIVADRETLEITRRAELPPGFWFHGGNAWEETDGTLRFDVNLARDPNILQALRGVMRGDHRRQFATTTLFTVAPSGRVASETVVGDSEFTRIDPRVATRRNRYVYSVEHGDDAAPWYDAVRRVDLARGRVGRFVYGAEYLVEEHVFVPKARADREGAGWLLGTALHWPSRRTCLSLFDAERLADGPVARAWAPLPAPLGFHGAFVPA